MKILLGITIAIIGTTAALALSYALGWTIQDWQYWAFAWPVCLISGITAGVVAVK